MESDITAINKKLDYMINILNDSLLTKDEYLEVKKTKKIITENKTNLLTNIDDI